MTRQSSISLPMFSFSQLALLCKLSFFSLSSVSLGQTVAEQHIELRATIEQWMQSVDRSQELEARWVNEESVLKDSIVGLKGMVEQADVDLAAVQARLDLSLIHI